MNNTLMCQCGICLNSTPKRLLHLYEHEKLLALKFLQIYKRHMPSSCSRARPRRVCEDCFKRLYNFRELLQTLHALKANVHHFHKRKMHANPDDSKEKMMESELIQPVQIRHEYNCGCAECESKHGNLPLLIEVMERSEVSDRTMAANTMDSQPSTSSSRQRMVTAKKQLQCTHCDKIFTHKGDFNKHLRKHTGDQPFECPTCHRKFAHTSNLHRHLRIHSGSRPFVCKSCDKSFSRKDKLESHLKSKICRKNSGSTSEN